MAGEAADAALADMQDLRRALEREIGRLLDRLAMSSAKPGTLSGDELALANATRVRQQIVDALENAGERVTVSVMRRRQLEEARAAVPAVDLGDFQADVLPELDQIARSQTREIAASWGEAGDEIRRAINRGIATGVQLSSLRDQVAERLAVATSKASAVVDAAVMGAGRIAVVTTARAAIGDVEGDRIVYAYRGPQDAKTRPFCRRYARTHALTDGALRTLDNGQGIPVEWGAGGYNCRHTLAPMLESQARARGLIIVEG